MNALETVKNVVITAGMTSGMSGYTSTEDKMRTLLEIIEDAKNGNMPTHEECYWAMLAIDSLAYFDHRALSQLAHEPSRFRTPEREAAESFRRNKTAYATSPKDWVGPTNDPANPDYHRLRKAAFKVLDKVSGDQNE